MRRGTVIGGLVWTVLVASSASDLFRLGLIELVFLLAPLVVVPLGLDLAERLSMGRSDCIRIKLPGWMRFPAALCVTASFWLAPGIGALTLVLPWFGLGCWLGFGALFSIVRGQVTTLKAACVTTAFLYLPIGCSWLVASRGGFAPMGFQEPIVLLTAVHFHFAGFRCADHDIGNCRHAREGDHSKAESLVHRCCGGARRTRPACRRICPWATYETGSGMARCRQRIRTSRVLSASRERDKATFGASARGPVGCFCDCSDDSRGYLGNW